jgi:hypothetical protein
LKSSWAGAEKARDCAACAQKKEAGIQNRRRTGFKEVAFFFEKIKSETFLVFSFPCFRLLDSDF